MYVSLDTPFRANVIRGNYYQEISSTLQEFLDVNNIPYTAVDAVPVVRCKNCVFYGKEPEIARAMNLEPEIYCALNRIEMGFDAFCSYGRITPWFKEEK